MIKTYAYMTGYLSKEAAEFGGSPGLSMPGATKEKSKGLGLSGAGKSVGAKQSTSIKGALTDSPIPKAPQTSPAAQFGNPFATRVSSSSPNQAVQPLTTIQATGGQARASASNVQQVPVNPAVATTASQAGTATSSSAANDQTNLAAEKETATNQTNRAINPVTNTTFEQSQNPTINLPRSIRPM